MATINLLVEIPVANPFKFILDGANSDERADFDQRRLALVKNASGEYIDFHQPVEKADANRVQFYSNFPLNKVTIVDCDDVVYGAPMTPSVAVQYRNKKYRSACKFATVNDKLFIYFIEGLEYTDEDFLVPGNLVALNGVTPNINALSGDVVRLSVNAGVDFIATTIDEIIWVPDLQAEGYLTNLDYSLLDPIDGLVEITYDQKPTNLLSQLLDFTGLAEGQYFVRYEVGVADYTISFTSEPIDVREKHPDTLALKYRHVGTFDKSDIWNYIYLSDWFNIIRIPTDFYKFIPAGEVEIDTNDSGIPRMLRAVPYRQLQISFINMPGWFADKMQVALSHDTKVINDYEWELADNYGNFEMIDQLDQGTYEVNLRQKNDRTKKTNTFSAEITASFDPDSFAAIPFAGDVLEAEFISNTLGVFRFVSLPPWIETDVETFQNGDIVEFTIAANATLFERSIQLIAISDDFDNLQATIDFQQDYDDTEPQFIDVDDHDVELSGSNGSNQLLTVTSSGDFDIVEVSGFDFTVVKESGFTQLRITAPSENAGPGNRTALIRLELQANPAVFVEIDVTQLVRVGLFGSEPTAFTFSSSGGGDSLDVEASAGTSWQASSNQSWCIVDGALKTGNASVSVFVNGRDLFIPAPRFAQITIINTANPSDTLTIIVQQN